MYVRTVCPVDKWLRPQAAVTPVSADAESGAVPRSAGNQGTDIISDTVSAVIRKRPWRQLFSRTGLVMGSGFVGTWSEDKKCEMHHPDQ